MPTTTQTALLPPIYRSEIAQETLQKYAMPLTSMRVHDAMATVLTGTANNDDMGLITGTPGTDAPTLQGVDFGGTTSDEMCAFEFSLPVEYDAGNTITIRVRATITTTVADDACTVDVEAWKKDDDGAVGSDLCTTSLQSINGTADSPANYDFTITPTGLAAGDELIVRISFAGNDAGDAGVMIPEISKVSVLLDIRG